jgi:hypothetical protein
VIPLSSVYCSFILVKQIVNLFFRALKYSQQVNTNLCPFFGWFGWPISEATKAVCETLPTWDKNPLEIYESESVFCF